MKKILFVINTMGQAGAEVALLELLSLLNPKEYQLYLYVLTGQGELVSRIPENVTLLNEHYCNQSVLSKEGQKYLTKKVLHTAFVRANIFKNFGYVVSNLLSMLKKRKVQPDKLVWKLMSDSAPQFKEEYDLAVAYLEGGSTYYVANHVNAKKKAAFVHIDYTQAGYTRNLDRNCYDKIDKIFTVSKEAQDSFLMVYPEYKNKTAIFHNLINQEMMKVRAKEPGGFADDYDGYRILTVGRLNYQKAYDIAIDAMKLLKEKKIHAKWYILGEGVLREELQSKIDRLGLSEDFLLLGATSNPFPYYEQCDLYVHATRFEGKSIAIQEAQTLGCAIIASDCQGNREQITNEVDGLLCELSPEGIAKDIIRMIEDSQLRKACSDQATTKVVVYKEELPLLLDMAEGK